MMMRTGKANTAKNNGVPSDTLSSLFEMQQEFQKFVTAKETLPCDDTHWFSYHIQAMVEELGEVLKADKRWKTHRNTNYEPSNKLEEISDVFITAINLAVFSGFGAEQVYETINNKICENFIKVKGIK